MNNKKKLIAKLLIIVIMLYIPMNNKVQAMPLTPTIPENVTHRWNETSGHVSFVTVNNWAAVSSSTFIRFAGNSVYYVTGTGTSSVYYTMDPNTSSSPRSAQVTIYNTESTPSQTIVFTITQQGYDPSQAIVLDSSQGGTYDYQSRELIQRFTSVGDWTVSSNASFLTCSKTSGSGSNSQQNFKINLAANTGRESRTGTITISSAQYNCTKQIIITQTGAPDFYDIRSMLDVTFFNNMNASNSAYLSFTASVPWVINHTSGVAPSRESGGPGTYTINFTVFANGGNSEGIWLISDTNTLLFNVHKYFY